MQRRGSKGFCPQVLATSSFLMVLKERGSGGVNVGAIIGVYVGLYWDVIGILSPTLP